eukprot:10304512-Alexandrium_andersonii.AAC.1
MAHRDGSMPSPAPPRRQADGSCIICGAWTCHHLLLGEAEDQEKTLQLGVRLPSERGGQSPPPPTVCETRSHEQDDDGAVQGLVFRALQDTPSLEVVPHPHVQQAIEDVQQDDSVCHEAEAVSCVQHEDLVRDDQTQ